MRLLKSHTRTAWKACGQPSYCDRRPCGATTRKRRLGLLTIRPRPKGNADHQHVHPILHPILGGSAMRFVIAILLLLAMVAGQALADRRGWHRKPHRKEAALVNHGRIVSSRRLSAIRSWKATEKKGPPPWAGVGGGPGGNPNHPGQGHDLSKRASKPPKQ